MSTDTFGEYKERPRNQQGSEYRQELSYVMTKYFQYLRNLMFNNNFIPIGPEEVYEIIACGFHVANYILKTRSYGNNPKNEDLSFMAAAILFAALGTYLENNNLTESSFHKIAINETGSTYRQYSKTWIDLVPIMKNFCPHFVFEDEMIQYKNNIKKLKASGNPVTYEVLQDLSSSIRDNLLEFVQHIGDELNNPQLVPLITVLYNKSIKNESLRDIVDDAYSHGNRMSMRKHIQFENLKS